MEMNDKILTIGGCELSQENNIYNSVDVYDIQINKSISGLQLPIAVRGSTCHHVNDKLYLIGGCTEFGKDKLHIKSIQIYDFSTKIWNINQFSLNEGRSCHISEYIQNLNSIIIFGGFQQPYTTLNSVEILQLDQENNYTMTLPPLPMKIKNGYSYQYEGNIYLFGGWDEKNTQKTVFKYNLEQFSCSWEGFINLPVEGKFIADTQQFQGHTVGGIGEIAYIFGGFDGFQVTDTIQKYNILTRKCEIVNEIRLNQKRENHSLVKIDDKVYIIGGWNGNKSLSDIEIFNITKDSITKYESKSELSIPRNRPCSCTI